MLNYKTVTVGFTIGIALSIIIYWIIPCTALYLIAFFILSYIIILAYGSSHIQSGFYLNALFEIRTDEKLIALSFDDGPTEVTNDILDVLKEYDISAAFFVVGERILGNEKILKRINDENHIIGNHSFSHHFWFDLFSQKRMLAELKKNEKIIYDIISKKVKLFRPPYGVTNPNLKRAVSKMNYITIGWSIKSKDTVFKKDKIISERLAWKLKPGTVILFHDRHKNTVLALKAFIEFALQNEYKIIRIDKLFKIQAYENADY